MAARIYKSFKSATQSGKKFLNKWVVEFIPETKNFIEPVMGWTGGCDTLASEVKLYFDSKEDAMDYAASNFINYEVTEQAPLKHVCNAYVDNFLK